MANVNDSIKIILRNEGGYNCAYGTSGETYKGIDRNYSSNWQGWQIIDTAKATEKLDAKCSRRGEQTIKNTQLDSLVNGWYLQNLLPYFNNKLSNISNQTLANFIADFVWHKPYRAIYIANSIANQLQPGVITSINYLTPQVLQVINNNASTFYKMFYQKRLQYYNNPKSINNNWDELFIASKNGLINRVKKFPQTLSWWTWIF